MIFVAIRQHGRRLLISAQLKQLPPPTANVNESIGWINDDILLLSLSLAANLKQTLKSIATPLVFQSMQLHCVPTAEASASFLQSSRVFIPNLDSARPTEQQASSKSRSSSTDLSSQNAKIDSILHHPHLQHKNALALRSFDVLEWLEFAESQLEAACSFETAEIPNLLLFQGNKELPGQRRWSEKERWKFQMGGGVPFGERGSLIPADVKLLQDLNAAKKLQQNPASFEEASFDPLQLLSRMSMHRNQDASQVRAHNEKVVQKTQRGLFLSNAVEQVQECVRAESSLAVARAKKEAPAKIASLQEELFRLQREVEISNRAQEVIESRKQAQAASKSRALKAAKVERARSLRVLNTQNNLRQSWQQFVGNLHPARCFAALHFFVSESLVSSCAFSVASLDYAARKPGSQNTFERDVKELLRARCLAMLLLLSSPFGFVFVGFMSYFEQYEKIGACAGQPAQRKGTQSAHKAGSKRTSAAQPATSPIPHSSASSYRIDSTSSMKCTQSLHRLREGSQKTFSHRIWPMKNSGSPTFISNWR